MVVLVEERAINQDEREKERERERGVSMVVGERGGE